MVEVSCSDTRDGSGNLTSNGYDADGNQLWSTSWADASTSYATSYQYDWRDRQTGELGPDGVATVYEYFDASNNLVSGIDNLGRIIGTQTYGGISSLSSLPSVDLRAQTRSLYDNLGQVYETRVYQVAQENDPLNTPGTIVDYLPTYNWYDAAGNLIKTETGGTVANAPGASRTWTGAFEKYQYDPLGRLTVQYTGCATSPETSAEVFGSGEGLLGLNNDSIVEQTQTWYDAADEAVGSATYRRCPSSVATTADGPLTASNSYTTASATFYDGVGRVAGTADFGREDTGEDSGGHGNALVLL